MAFRITCTQKIFQMRIAQQGIAEEDYLCSGGGAFNLQANLNYNLSVIDKKDQIMQRC